MENVDGEESVILIQDDETESILESSVVLVESSEEIPSHNKKADRVMDEECELMVTFCKRPKMMPHARYDCMTYPFVRAECETSAPLEGNAETCGECYCYICNTPVAECKDWVTPSLCHCNAHNKSQYWKDQWNFALTGGLAVFNLELSDIDADVQRGGTLLQKFMHDVSVEYNQYLVGERAFPDCHSCFCHRNLGRGQCDFCGLHSPVIYRYTSVSDLVIGFLNQARKEKPKAEAVVLLGVAREIALHKDPSAYSQNMDHSASLSRAVMCLMDRITQQLQRLLILNDFPRPLHDKLIKFYKSIPFPIHCYRFVERLDFIAWDHGLLTSVLRGQNITGQRLQKGKKEILFEGLPVIEARVERMEMDQRYKEMIRYLKVVKCYDFQGIRDQRDKIPFYLCRTGEMEAAAQALFTSYPQSCCAACRLSPFQFETYLKMFRTGQVPWRMDVKGSILWSSAGTPLKLRALIKWTFKLLYSSTALYKNPKCWSSVIRTFSSPPFLAKGHLMATTFKEPPQDFQQTVFLDSCFYVDNFSTQIQARLLSKVFADDSHPEASLIVAARAVRQMVLMEYHSLNSFLEIILAFGSNFWALKLLLESLGQYEKVLKTIIGLTVDDLNCRKTEMLSLWQSLGPQYVGGMLSLFLTSRDKNVPSVGFSIICILKENLQQCPWAKEVGKFLQNSKDLACPSSEVSSFIEVALALP